MTRADDVIAALGAARRGVRLYPAGHPAFTETLDALVGAVSAATADGRSLVVNWHQGRLYHESTVIPADVVGATSVAGSFESHGIESMTFHPGFSAHDALALTEVLASKPGPDYDVTAELAGRQATAVTISVLADEDDADREERDRDRAADRALHQRAIAALRELQRRMSNGGAEDLGDTSSLVNDVMGRLVADQNAVMALATIRGSSEHELYHSLNVMIYSLALGKRLGLPEEGLTSLGLSALLHDVGKTAFNEHEPAQAETMRLKHPSVGAEILQRVAPADPAPLLVAFEHHMGADGGGWPERPQGYVPHPFSRMVAIANRYDNLVSPGDGARPMTPDRAVVKVLEEGSASLDPLFTRLFASAIGAFPVGCLVRLSDHSVGVVSDPGTDPLAPTVRLAYDADGVELEDRPDVDLSTTDVRIVEVVDPASLDVAVADKL
jgi:putative nucleotidyltransferase with HDIG domain